MVWGHWENLVCNGQDRFLDCSDLLGPLLHTENFHAQIRFSTSDPGYQTLFAVYYKESDRPDFSIELHKGIVTVGTRHGGQGRVLSGGPACCDGRLHTLHVQGTAGGLAAWLDGARILSDPAVVPYCTYGYVGFATIGRGTLQDRFAGYFHGFIESFRLSDEVLPVPGPDAGTGPLPLFAKGMAGCENFRIPTILTTGDGTVIASADARLEAPGDNPNHIARAVRISRDGGGSWSPVRLFCDYGGEGRTDGAAAIDGALLYDGGTDTVWMLYSHTSAGIGSAASCPGTGFDEAGRKILTGDAGDAYYLENGAVYTAAGRPTGYTADPLGRLFRDGRPAGSICHGRDRRFRQADTSFLQLVCSRDGGETWSDPVDLNPQVKAPWMKFIGAGPGRGIQLTRGRYAGRLVYPVYFSTCEGSAYSSAAIYSDDHGATWRMGASVNDGRLLDGRTLEARTADLPRAMLGECQITELADGTLKIFLRNAMGRRTCTAESRDGGASWACFRQEEDLLDPECQSSVLRVERGGRTWYLFANPEDEQFRVRGTLKYSPDGVHWRKACLIEPGEFGYSCMTLLPDGQLGILYEGRDITQYFRRLPLDFLDGK